MVERVPVEVCRAATTVVRRAVTIVTMFLLFHNPVSFNSWMGVLLIIGGSVGYALAKKSAPPKATVMDGSEEDTSEDGLVTSSKKKAALPQAAEVSRAGSSSHSSPTD